MAVGDAYVFPGFLTPVLTQLFFPKPPTTFPTGFCRGERRKYAGKKVASAGDRTHSHQVMSPTRSPLSHPGGALIDCMVFKRRSQQYFSYMMTWWPVISQRPVHLPMLSWSSFYQYSAQYSFQATDCFPA